MTRVMLLAIPSPYKKLGRKNSLARDKALGPDGFPRVLYQEFWELVTLNLLPVYEFHPESETLKSVNSTFITRLGLIGWRILDTISLCTSLYKC